MVRGSSPVFLLQQFNASQGTHSAGMNAISEGAQGDAFGQEIGTGTGIDHPEFIQARIGDGQMHRTGGVGGIGPLEFHPDAPAANLHQQVEF